MRAGLLLAGCILVASCGSEAPPPEQTSDFSPDPLADPLAAPARLPLQASAFPALQSEDCAMVTSFYREAIEARDFPRAALVWDDPVVDGARLEALFSGYRQPRLILGEPLEGAGPAGALTCTFTGGLTDAADPARPPRQGTLTLRRPADLPADLPPDLPGATPDQLRWTVQSSTFVEPMERAGRGEPA